MPASSEPLSAAGDSRAVTLDLGGVRLPPRSAGRQDGTLAVEHDLTDVADTLFNTACWGYVHLRARHRWSKARARRNTKALLLDGISRA